MTDNNSLQTNGYYKNLNKHENCSKCDIVLTQDNYKKERTVCKKCYNNNVLAYYKNKFGSNSPLKTDVSTQTDFSDNQDCSRKQVRSRKEVSTRKQDDSNKQETSINYITDVDPNLLCDKLREILEKPDRIESDSAMIKMIVAELLRVKAITKRQYNNMCKNLIF